MPTNNEINTKYYWILLITFINIHLIYNFILNLLIILPFGIFVSSLLPLFTSQYYQFSIVNPKFMSSCTGYDQTLSSPVYSTVCSLKLKQHGLARG